jgi:thymidylate synthase (FAD)
MTLQKDVLNNPSYIPYLDHGFVGLKDVMGNDKSIVEAARVSYGDGTKTVSEDRSLIRYLVKNYHTTPLEMVEFKFHIKIPIFVMRQHVRHRMATINEYSGRYSIMTDEFYIPPKDRLQAQSKTNKQGSGEELVDREKSIISERIHKHTVDSYDTYLSLLNSEEAESYHEDHQGLSRELSRIVLPLNNYTELYWKIDLKNLLHYMQLRSDHHAQQEIISLSNLFENFVREICPIAFEAFEDYWKNRVNISKMDNQLLQDIINYSNSNSVSFLNAFNSVMSTHSSEANFLNSYRLSKREFKEFKEKFSL